MDELEADRLEFIDANEQCNQNDNDCDTATIQHSFWRHPPPILPFHFSFDLTCSLFKDQRIRL
jgi:hypothetical protein